MDTRVLPVAGALEDFSDDDDGFPYDTNALQLTNVIFSVANMIAGIFILCLCVAAHLMDPKHFAKQVLNWIEKQRPRLKKKKKDA